MDEDDTTTPRSLISAIFKHNEPQKTVRRSSRRTSHSNSLHRPKKEKEKQLKSQDQPAATQKKDKSSKPLEIVKETTKTTGKAEYEENEMALSDATPRGLINMILQKHNVTKTLRVAVRHVHPEIIQKDLSSPHSEVDSGNTERDQLTEQNLVVSPDGDELQKRKKTEKEETLKGLPVKSGDIQKTEQFKKYKPRTKRLRLSNIELLNATAVPDDSFTSKILSHLESQVKNKQNSPDAVVKKRRKISEGVQTSFESRLEDSPSIFRDYSAKYGQSHDIGDHHSFETPENSPTESLNQDLLPPSDIDIESQLGPLELGRITEEDYPNGSSSENILIQVHNSVENDSKQQENTRHNQEYGREADSNMRLKSLRGDMSPEIPISRGHSLDRQEVLSTIQQYQKEDDSVICPESMNEGDSIKIIKVRGYSMNQQRLPDAEQEVQGKEDSDIWPDSMLQDLEFRESNSLNQEYDRNNDEYTRPKSNQGDVDPGDLELSNNLIIGIQDNNPSQKKVEVPVRKSSTLRKVRRKSRLESNLPLTRNHLFKLTRHFARRKFTSHALVSVQELSRRYFAATARDVEQICQKGRKKCITLEAVETLMKRRGVITEKKTLDVLVEENFPLEYRQLLIPVAISGNKIFPEEGK